MSTVIVKCPSCDKKVLSYEYTRVQRYESPIKVCKHCGAKYLDPRSVELAIMGIPEAPFSVLSAVCMMVLGALILWRGIYLFQGRFLGMPEALWWLMPGFFTICGIVLIVGGIVEIILIKSGRRLKKLERLLRESEERMASPIYANELKSLGYPVPERFL